MALLSSGGTSIAERCARASTRPVASRGGTSSISPTGRAPESSTPSPSSTERMPLFIELQVLHYESRDGGVVVQVEERKSGLPLRVGRQRDDVRIVGVQQRVPRLRPPRLELRNRRE